VPSAEQRNDELVNALRRGRSSNTEAELQAAATRSVDQDEIGRTKRGRPSVTHREEDAVVGGSAKDQPAPTRRGRPRVSQVDELAELEIPVEDIESSKLLRRGRSSNTGAGVQAAVESSAKEYAGRKKRTRRSDAEIEVPVVDKFLPAENIGPKQHKQGKPHIKIATSSLAKDRSNQKNLAKPSKIVNTITVEGSSEAQEPTKSKKRGRPSNAGVLEGTGSATGQSKRTKSRRASDPEVQKRKHKEVEGRKVLLVLFTLADLNLEAEDSHRPNRSRLHKDSQQEENETSHIASLPVYQHLAVVTRRVPRHTIEAKWEPLTQVCIERVSQLLEDIQKPVVVRLNDEHRRTQSSTALEMVSRRLVRKLSRGLPFPQGTRNHREDDFDFEKILDHSRAIESQLTPALHANELLEAEIRKETALLQSEKAALAELEANAKTEASKRREAGRKLHSLLQANDSTMEEDDLRDQIGLDIDHIPPSLTLNVWIPVRDYLIEANLVLRFRTMRVLRRLSGT
jgi:hypothetical protein